jgi:hypothetical protein
MDQTYVVYDGYMFEFDLSSDFGCHFPHRPKRDFEPDGGDNHVQAEPGESVTIARPFDIK